MKTYPTLFYDIKGLWGVFVLFYFLYSFQYRDVMNGFTYILLSVWFAWCQVFISGKLIHACHISLRSIVEVAVGMLCVPSLWLLLRCVCTVLIRILHFSVSRWKRYPHFINISWNWTSLCISSRGQCWSMPECSISNQSTHGNFLFVTTSTDWLLTDHTNYTHRVEITSGKGQHS